MPTRLALGLCTAFSIAIFAGCAAENAEEDDATLSADADLTSTIALPAFGQRTLTLDAATARDVTLTLDCAPPDNPDDRGPVVALEAPSLGISSGGPAPAGYFTRTGPVAEGSHTLTISNQGPAVRCQLKTLAVPSSATCREWNEWRSANTDHTHYRVGSEGAAAGWDPFPASGNHWGAWAPWNSVYDAPVKTGFVLHNLEHGGLVFSYKCASATESPACTQARDQLVALAQSLGVPRLVVTPDPSQPTMFAVRAWRWAYTADCLDERSAGAFARAHYRKGREDTDADPPIPYDPTTTNVPCQDLMSAPDSCGY